MKLTKTEHIRGSDYTAWYKCEHCGVEEKSYLYDDQYFRDHVIPCKKCKGCAKTSRDPIPINPTDREVWGY